tara:strand:- start:283 stop:396 length:114 start_codon:yes stop_codon:yes gene_type:complete
MPLQDFYFAFIKNSRHGWSIADVNARANIFNSMSATL